VAVRRRLYESRGGDIAAGTRPVLDKECLTERGGEARGDEAGKNIRSASGRKSDEDVDGLRRVIERRRDTRNNHEAGGCCPGLQKRSAFNSHRHFPERALVPLRCITPA